MPAASPAVCPRVAEVRGPGGAVQIGMVASDGQIASEALRLYGLP